MGLFIFLLKQHAQESWLLPSVQCGEQGVYKQDRPSFQKLVRRPHNDTPLGCQRTLVWEAGRAKGGDVRAGVGFPAIHVVLMAWHGMSPHLFRSDPAVLYVVGVLLDSRRLQAETSEVSFALAAMPRALGQLSEPWGSTPGMTTCSFYAGVEIGHRVTRTCAVTKWG